MPYLWDLWLERQPEPFQARFKQTETYNILYLQEPITDINSDSNVTFINKNMMPCLKNLQDKSFDIIVATYSFYYPLLLSHTLFLDKTKILKDRINKNPETLSTEVSSEDKTNALTELQKELEKLLDQKEDWLFSFLKNLSPEGFLAIDAVTYELLRAGFSYRSDKTDFSHYLNKRPGCRDYKIDIHRYPFKCDGEHEVICFSNGRKLESLVLKTVGGDNQVVPDIYFLQKKMLSH